MANVGGSRWGHTAADPDERATRRKEKEERKKAREKKEAQATSDEASNRPSKRLKTANNIDDQEEIAAEEPKLLSFPLKRFEACRSVEEYEQLNDIEEGSYGFVSRAKEKSTGVVVALKKLKMDYTSDGFPVTGLREIQTLMAARHAHIVRLQEVVTGPTLKDIYLVMDFVEHDLKTLLDDMAEPFLPSEIKTVMLQITSAVSYLHSHWILHRDLKTSNILMNNRGEVKLADFGMARYTAAPAPQLTQLVVTLWYRSPELLLGTQSYGFDIDIWSLGCIFAELLTKNPLFQGKNEVDQLSKIFATLGNPTPDKWPGFRSLPNAKALHPLLSASRQRTNKLSFTYLTAAGHGLLTSMLTLNPTSRPTASDALKHIYFREDPRPKHKDFFPTFPSKAGMEKRRRRDTPNAPVRGQQQNGTKLGAEDFAKGILGADDVQEEVNGGGFALRLG